MTKLKDCKKVFKPCQRCKANSPVFDKDLGRYRCWKCGETVDWEYVKK